MTELMSETEALLHFPPGSIVQHGMYQGHLFRVNEYTPETGILHVSEEPHGLPLGGHCDHHGSGCIRFAQLHMITVAEGV